MKNTQKFGGCLEALEPCELNDFILYALRFFAIKVQSLHRVQQKLFDREKQSFVHNLKIDQVACKLDCDDMIFLQIGLPDMGHVRAHHNEVKVGESFL